MLILTGRDWPAYVHVWLYEHNRNAGEPTDVMRTEFMGTNSWAPNGIAIKPPWVWPQCLTFSRGDQVVITGLKCSD